MRFISIITWAHFIPSERPTTDAYQDRDPYLNDKGQLAWYTYNSIENSSKFTIYTIDGKIKETFFPEVSFDYIAKSLQLNDVAQLLWTGNDGFDHEVYLASPLVAHDFTYYYGNGDYYERLCLRRRQRFYGDDQGPVEHQR